MKTIKILRDTVVQRSLTLKVPILMDGLPSLCGAVRDTHCVGVDCEECLWSSINTDVLRKLLQELGNEEHTQTNIS